MRYTPEPWMFHEQGEANEFCLLTADGKWVIAFRQNGEMLPEQQRANAIRIVACVNACQGVSTVALELMKFSLPLAYDQALKQRDELLGALLGTIEQMEQCKRMFRDDAAFLAALDDANGAIDDISRRAIDYQHNSG